MTTVTPLFGFWPHVTAAAAHRLLADRPSSRLLAFSTLEDLLTIAGRHDGDLLVTFPETWEPDRLRLTWTAAAPPDGVALGRTVTAVAADLLLDALADETVLPETGDDRGIGDVVAHQIEQADTIVLAELPDDDPWEAERLRVLLHRLAPWAAVLTAADDHPPAVAHSAAPLTPATRGLRGRAVGLHEPLPCNGVVSCVFKARRPFHPQRLHAALDDVIDQVLRSRGHLWLASRPELVLAWESAAALRLTPASAWLAGLGDDAWQSVHAERRIAADLDWDPYYGDRHQHLVFIGFDLDPVRLHRTLTACLLTDEELSAGEDEWRHLPDPFRPPSGALTPADSSEAGCPETARWSDTGGPEPT
ncbi:GTP-binding protein [Actinoplanes sp. NPDC049802]|uniref:GTP-binding protein n=1 Tax=Actinoplanes sp. NPDC049802 TaxID=3154742 RepID=UPI0033C5E81F